MIVLLTSILILVSLLADLGSSLRFQHAADEFGQGKTNTFAIKTCEDQSRYLTGNFQDLNSPLKFYTKEEAIANGRNVLKFVNEYNLQIKMDKNSQTATTHKQSHKVGEDWSLMQTWLDYSAKPKQVNKQQSWILKIPKYADISAQSKDQIQTQTKTQEQSNNRQLGIKPSGIVFNKRSIVLDDLSSINSGGNSLLYDFAECLACTNDDQQKDVSQNTTRIQLTQVNKMSTVTSFMLVDEDGEAVFLNKDKNDDRLRQRQSCFIIEQLS